MKVKKLMLKNINQNVVLLFIEILKFKSHLTIILLLIEYEGKKRWYQP